MIKRLIQSITLSLAVIFLGACSALTKQNMPVPTQPQLSAEIANPASVNCIRQGGTLSIRKHGSGGEYGVCVFEGGKQCEEWAMFRGECPAGGVKITGYVSQAAQYCVITGGEYIIITANLNADQEQGVCAFRTGKACDVRDYFDGKCRPNE
jgi:putative hemolysin